jgi:hypothetical protein
MPVNAAVANAEEQSQKSFIPAFAKTEKSVQAFIKLSPELHLHFFDFLDLHYLIRLTCTNSYLKGLLTEHRFQKRMLPFECSEDGEYALVVGRVMPCYGCVKIVSAREFPFLDDFSKYGLGFAKASERHCNQCDEKNGNAFVRLVDQETEDHEQREWESEFE